MTEDKLSFYDLVILANVPLKEKEEQLLTGYVREGGGLIALRPPVEMAELFGMTLTSSIVKTFSGGYVTFNPGNPIAGQLPVEKSSISRPNRPLPSRWGTGYRPSLE